jgi:ATP-dependent helicase HepA
MPVMESGAPSGSIRRGGRVATCAGGGADGGSGESDHRWVFSLDGASAGLYTLVRMQRPSPGQRWFSSSEPTLGLGLVRAFDGNTVEIEYPAAEERRLYAFESAPLVRVLFSPGDVIADRDGCSLTVEEVSSDEEIVSYHGGGHGIVETDLLDSLSFIRPDKRLLAGLSDHPRDFEQRVKALEWSGRIRQSPARGFTGARIDLLPHQLAIVAEAAGRLNPRILLADEVGLGKTIEACLIMHRLHLTGRADRVLILVPEPLVYQWFVELLRRFNLLFAIYDEARCSSIEAHDEEANPFLDSQLVLAATGLLADHAERVAQARAAGFDLMIVDEAHHLEWSPDDASDEYRMVEGLAGEIPSVLLLTATPQQLGPAGHFARLRLLDPDRYTDLDAFLEESHSYTPLAEAVEALHDGELPDDLEAFTSRSPRAAAHHAALAAGDESARGPLIGELVDSFGTGRVLFRNTRDRLGGFPERRPELYPLGKGGCPYQWLAGLLRSLAEDEKVLLITSTAEAAISVQEKLLQKIQVESALFHEDFTLLQRDRNAAWFADPEGARILICSEIGSEGRNFQFAHHLVLFGLPRDPELLEQRVGRLDRIGQTEVIHIHVPYGVGSASELHARWLHEGLDAFSRPLQGATALAEVLLPELDEIDPEAGGTSEFDDFLRRSREEKGKVAEELASGHDRLLELGAPPPERAADLLEAIRSADDDPHFERFAIRLFDHLGLDVSDLALRSYHFHRGQRHSEAFADLPEEGLSVTFDRENALAREDLAFLSADHPMFRDALEQLLDSESGNASFAHWETGQGKAVLLECVFVLEVLAPTRLHLDQFLPPTAIRVMVDHHGRGREFSLPVAALRPGNPQKLVGQEKFRREIFPKMLECARELAEEAAKSPAGKARRHAMATLDAEIERVEDLASRNPQVPEEEITGLRKLREESLAALGEPRLRLDALRLVWRT